MKLDITVNKEKTQVRVDINLPLAKRASDKIVGFLTCDAQKILIDKGHKVGKVLASPELGRVGNDSEEMCKGSWVFELRITQPPPSAPPPPPSAETSPSPRRPTSRKKRLIRTDKKED